MIHVTQRAIRRRQPSAPVPTRPHHLLAARSRRTNSTNPVTPPLLCSPTKLQPQKRPLKLHPLITESRFHWLNEQTYTFPPTAVFAHPGDYEAYCVSFRQQKQRWPSHSLDIVIQHLQSLTTPQSIADMGCGNTSIATTVASHTSYYTVPFFGLASALPLVTPANIVHIPLGSRSVDVLVHRVSLMPTEYAAVLGRECGC